MNRSAKISQIIVVNWSKLLLLRYGNTYCIDVKVKHSLVIHLSQKKTLVQDGEMFKDHIQIV